MLFLLVFCQQYFKKIFHPDTTLKCKRNDTFFYRDKPKKQDKQYISQANMDFEQEIIEIQTPKIKLIPENTLSCSQSNAKTNKQSVPKQSNNMKSPPFTIIKNYRVKQRKIDTKHKNTKRNSLKTKRRMSQSQQPQISHEILRLRKMTQSIEIEGISQEHYSEPSIESPRILKRAENQNEEFELEKKEEMWENPELEKMIPMEIREYALDRESPLQLTPQKNLYYTDPLLQEH